MIGQLSTRNMKVAILLVSSHSAIVLLGADRHEGNTGYSTYKRTDCMDSVVFDRHNLDLFHGATTSLYKIFLSVLEDEQLSKPYAQTDLLDKINQSIQTYWDPIKALFVADPYTGYESGQFTDQENIHPSKVFIDIFQGLNRFLEETKAKMDKSYSNEVEFRKEIRTLKEELLATKQELRQVNTEHLNCKMEIGSSKGTIAHLEKLNKEKAERIAELQRADTVQLWEKEKVRLLESNAKRMEELEKTVEELKSEKTSLQQKLQHFETKLGVEKLKREMHENKQSVIETEKTDTQKANGEAGQPVQQGVLQLRQHIYVLEKDLRKVDSEIHAQQKCFIGILGGLRRDYDITFKRLIDHGDEEIEGLEPNTILRAKGLRQVLYKLYDLAQNGKLNQAVADLPEYYIALDRDVHKGLVRKISTTYNPTGLTPIPKKKDSSLGTDAIQEEKKPIPSITANNPQIVDERTGIVNHIMVLKHFPHFTKEYVQEQYDNFKAFDTNDDRTLDITEVMSAMTKTLGQQFKASQIKEAMLEVDVDGNNTLDFYEYLKVADMLSHKNGHSEVFKSKLVMDQGRTMSKTCIVM